MKKTIIMTLCLLMAGILFAQTTTPADAPQGGGTEANPFLIENIAHLRFLSEITTSNPTYFGNSNLSIRHYRQTAHIDAAETEHWNDGAGFKQIGQASTASYIYYDAGIYDGDGFYTGENYSISNLKIRNIESSNNNVGLFTTVRYSTIKNLDLLNIDYNLSNSRSITNIGGIVGSIAVSTIENCNVTGNINTTELLYIGGIVGNLSNGSYSGESIILNCSSAVNITIELDATNTTGRNAGGIVGSINSANAANTTLVKNNKFTGSINTTINGSNAAVQLGSIVGYARGNVSITENFSTGNITYSGETARDIGGIVGNVMLLAADTFAKIVIKDNFYTGQLSDTGTLTSGGVGGIIGNIAMQEGTINIQNNYSAGSMISSATNFAGIVGRIGNYTGLDISNNYWNTTLNSSITAAFRSGSPNTGGDTNLGRTTEQLQMQSSFVGYDFTDIWNIHSNVNSGYPYLIGNPPFVLNPPTNLRRTNAENEFAVELAWDEPIGSSMDVSFYSVFRNSVSIATPTAVTFTDETPGEHEDEVSYTVVAVYFTPDGESKPTTALNITVYNPTFNPPINLIATEISTAMIKLAWETPADGSTGTLAGFNVYRQSETETETEAMLIMKIDDPKQTNFDDDISEEVSEEYEYWVTAVYEDPDGESEPSEIVSVKFTSILPVTLSEFGATSVDGGVKIYWTVETETNMLGYRVWRADSIEYPPTFMGGAGGGYISNHIASMNNLTTEHYYYIDTDVVNGKEYFYWLVAIENDGSLEVFGPVNVVYTPDGDQPITMTTMSSAYPNPMSLGSLVSFDISVKADETAELSVYNIRGQLVRSYDGLDSGKQTVVWDGRDFNGREVSSGVYFYRLTSPSSHIVHRMVIVK